MEKIIFRLIIITGACCLSTKHIFHSWMDTSWENARGHCMKYHNDLSRLSNELEDELFRDSVDQNNEGWIGIYWDKTLLQFMWSGGDDVTYNENLNLPTNIDPNNPPHKDENVYWTKDQWQWKNGNENHNFFCFSLTLVQEEKTWEEALELCRMNHNNLSSLLSDTDTLLATNEMNRTDSTDPAWIGLRYLGDEWMWVDGESLEYKAWSQGDQDHRCPMKRRCGALTKQGVWENRDCQEKLWFMCG